MDEGSKCGAPLSETMRHAFIGVVVRSLPLLAVLVVHVSSSLPLCRCNTSFNWNTLMTVYDALNGSQWVNVDGTHNVTVRWDSGNGSTVCDWYGVTCDNSTGNITGISFPSIRYLDVNNHWGCYDLGLAGTLPSAIGGLSESLTVVKFCGQIGVGGHRATLVGFLVAIRVLCALVHVGNVPYSY